MKKKSSLVLVLAVIGGVQLLISCASHDKSEEASDARPVPVVDAMDGRMAGPDSQGPPMPHRRGNATSGKEVFRFETFGNEGFWTDAMKMPKGMEDAKQRKKAHFSRNPFEKM